MTSKHYDVSVSFTLEAASAEDAERLMVHILHDFEQWDQLPNWYVNGAEELLGPDDTYVGRTTDGETTP